MIQFVSNKMDLKNPHKTEYKKVEQNGHRVTIKIKKSIKIEHKHV